MENQTTTPQATDSANGMKSALSDVKAKAADKRQEFDRSVSDSPEKAVAIAIGAGYLLHILPAGKILSGTLGLAAFLVKPTLLALGAIKACELLQEQAKK